MHRERPFLEISPWVAAPADLQAPLASDLRVDLAVVGGGYTGLSAALAARQAGLDVALVESDFAGAGASGRNAGHLTPTIGKDIPTLLRMQGRERAGRWVDFAEAAVAHTEELIRKHGIDCGYDPSGNVMAGVHPRHAVRLERAARAAQEVGACVRFLSAGEMRERGLPSAFLCGVLEERGGTLDPGRYVMGLRRAALAAGVRIFERCPALDVCDGAPVRVRTREGSLLADRVVLATNAYTPQLAVEALGWRPRRVSPLRVTLFETAPLSREVRDALGWRGREGVYTAHEILESYRLTHRGTVVGGSKVVRFGFGKALPPAYDAAAFAAIESAFRERFPSLREVPIAHFFGGWIGLTSDFLPTIGSSGARGHILHGIGYAGHGVAQASLVGTFLAERVQGRVHEWDAELARRIWSWPPEPFRWLAASALDGVLRAIDRRTDRQVRKRA